MSTIVDDIKSAMKRRTPTAVNAYRYVRDMIHGGTETWSQLIDKLERTTPDVFFVEIGAMDGVSFDPLYEHVTRKGWRGLLVEPLEDMFAELRKNYGNQSGLIFENVAIADEPGQKNMYRVNPDAVKKNLVPYWAKGISSFYLDRNEIGGAGTTAEIFGQIRPHVGTQAIRCDTLENLLEKHRINRIDILQIDTEGHDYSILQQLDFTRFKPRIIRMEWSVLSYDERRGTEKLLTSNGYRWMEIESDLVAWRPFSRVALFKGWLRSGLLSGIHAGVTGGALLLDVPYSI